MTPRELDEDDVRIRPKRSSRPRTKDRPDYSGATIARIIAVDRGRSCEKVICEIARVAGHGCHVTSPFRASSALECVALLP